ncbi:hypothetical protein [Engelhardtia mirabilis]
MPNTATPIVEDSISSRVLLYGGARAQEGIDLASEFGVNEQALGVRLVRARRGADRQALFVETVDPEAIAAPMAWAARVALWALVRALAPPTVRVEGQFDTPRLAHLSPRVGGIAAPAIPLPSLTSNNHARLLVERLEALTSGLDGPHHWAFFHEQEPSRTGRTRVFAWDEAERSGLTDSARLLSSELDLLRGLARIYVER